MAPNRNYDFLTPVEELVADLDPDYLSVFNPRPEPLTPEEQDRMLRLRGRAEELTEERPLRYGELGSPAVNVFDVDTRGIGHAIGQRTRDRRRTKRRRELLGDPDRAGELREEAERDLERAEGLRTRAERRRAETRPGLRGGPPAGAGERAAETGVEMERRRVREVEREPRQEEDDRIPAVSIDRQRDVRLRRAEQAEQEQPERRPGTAAGRTFGRLRARLDEGVAGLRERRAEGREDRAERLERGVLPELQELAGRAERVEEYDRRTQEWLMGELEREAQLRDQLISADAQQRLVLDRQQRAAEFEAELAREAESAGISEDSEAPMPISGVNNLTGIIRDTASRIESERDSMLKQIENATLPSDRQALVEEHEGTIEELNRQLADLSSLAFDISRRTGYMNQDAVNDLIRTYRGILGVDKAEEEETLPDSFLRNWGVPQHRTPVRGDTDLRPMFR